MARGDLRAWLLTHVFTDALQGLFGAADKCFTDWKWLGFLGWAGVWVYWSWGLHAGNLPERIAHAGPKWMMVFGLDLVVLAAWQHTEYWMIVLITFNILNSFLAKTVFHSMLKNEKQNPFRYKAENVYEDISLQGKSLVPCVYVIGQVSCIFLVLYACLPLADEDIKKEEGNGKINYLFWLMSFIVVQVCGIFSKKGGSGQLGATWNMAKDAQFKYIAKGGPTIKWRKVIKNEDGEVVGGEWFEQSSWNMWVHRYLGFLVNTVLRDVLAFLIPILLMQSDEPTDFLQNAFFIGFITMLDDIPDGAELEIQQPATLALLQNQ